MYYLQEAEVAKLTALLQKTEMKAKSLELTVEQKVKENEVDASPGAIKCTRLSGPCYVNSNLGLPCAHLFFTRVANKEDLITEN